DMRFGQASHVPVLLAGLISIILMVRRWQGLRGAAGRAIDHFNDARVTGPLLMALEDSSHELRLVAREVLLNLLPRLRPIHANYLAEAQRERLIALLDGDDVPLAIAALQALTHIGDGEMLTRIRPLAVGEGLAANRPQVRDAAQNCLSEIMARQTR